MSSVEHITSRQNPLVGHIRRLNASRAYRREWGEFVCDGPKLLAEALRWGAEITAVVAEEERRVERISSVSSEAVMLSWMAFWKADASILMALSIWLLSLPMFCWMAVLSWDCIWSWWMP